MTHEPEHGSFRALCGHLPWSRDCVGCRSKLLSTRTYNIYDKKLMVDPDRSIHEDRQSAAIPPAAVHGVSDTCCCDLVESRMRLLIEKTGDMVWTVNMDMVPTYISSSVRYHLGYSQDEAMSVRMEDMFSPDSYCLAMKILAEELARDRMPASDLDRSRIFELDLVHKNGHIVPFEICYSALRNAQGRPTEIMAVARNITERRRFEAERHSHTARMIGALSQTVQALATLLEMRDPYTAGHQRRVAAVASIIGQRLGLSAEMVEGLRLAGLIHDIGKVRIPSEILTTTRELCAAELEIVRMHPTTGYDVLRGIEFPWPIADAVHQHHERLNGSGYPQGLKDGDIILEARILAVVDVVEAIASDRPYRQAYGIEAAIDHVMQHRGKLFDASVVDACAETFRAGACSFGNETLPGAFADCRSDHGLS